MDKKVCKICGTKLRNNNSTGYCKKHISLHTGSIIHGCRANIDVVRQYASDHGGKLLSTEYINALSPLQWQCELGHMFTTTFNHVKNRGQWCSVCAQIKRTASVRARFANDADLRARISKSHKERLEKLGHFSFKLNHRQLASRIRDHTTGLLRNPAKHKGILVLLCCSIEELRTHLENKFYPNPETGEAMSWDNRGFYGWHIDHIVPLSYFDLDDPEQLKRACHYTNLQPLWAKDNLVKSNKTISSGDEYEYK